ncbi:amidohydrolase [Pusillimonas sp. TS35]|uniref:M20 family metallopeptidase n=1 Tax=Paracandidimonas lactea TaxID=2895524 RepID=UPI001370276D|nr:M20 family metallopeptidase [Paracandidimonas lactea]MYN14515.1 amidohydrolase [Pusillimonas sp. TS35]
MDELKELSQMLDAQRERYTSLSDRIWELAELRFQETESAAMHADMLEAEGFRVQRGVAGMPTAFIAEAGDGGPVVGILGEYDALSGMSQESGALVCTPSTDIPNGNGHGCGHHLLGTAAHAAVVAVKALLQAQGMPGRVRFYGCPAEEGGSGKTYMARAGLFDDVDAVLTWHPASYTGTWTQSSLANLQASFRFKGVAAHAANAPHLGRSALDAVELMNVGCNYLREHMPSDARFHYAVTNTGGMSPNVVQSDAEVLYLIRAPRNEQVDDLYARIQRVAQGAALMTDCKVEIIFDKACSNYMPNRTLNDVLDETLRGLDAPHYSEAEQQAAQGLFGVISDSDIASANSNLGQVLRQPKPLFQGVASYRRDDDRVMFGSTDVGDVSWVAPTAQFWGACYAYGTAFHSWQMVSQGKQGFAHKGMLYAAKALAATAYRLMGMPETLARAKAELQDARNGQPYKCPIPPTIEPRRA